MYIERLCGILEEGVYCVYVCIYEYCMYTYVQERCGILEDELRRIEAQREEDLRRLQEMTTLREKDADQAHVLKTKKMGIKKKSELNSDSM
jgi:hypothetical protein